MAILQSSVADSEQPILIELHDASWEDKLDRVERWLDNTLMIQSGFRRLAERVRDKLHEPHFRQFVAEIADTAARHEREAEQLFRFIGRNPSLLRRHSGAAVEVMRSAWADVVGFAGGAAEPFRSLQQLFISSLNATSAFATAEQLGLAIGNQELAESAFSVVAEKYKQHLLLQEITLESAATAILYGAELAEPEHKLRRSHGESMHNVGNGEQLVRLSFGAIAGAAALGILPVPRLLRPALAPLAVLGLGTGVIRYCPMKSHIPR